MKILVVSHEFPPIGGGGANACYFLTKGFVEAGHIVTLVTSNYKKMPENECINGVSVIRVNAVRAYKEQCSFWEMLSYLIKAWPIVDKLEKRERFDVCLVFFGIPSGPLGYLLKKKYKLSYVIRFGGGDVPGFQERFIKIYKLIGPAIKAVWRNAESLIANSQGLRNMAMSYYDRKEFKIICNGVDTKVFFPINKKESSIFEILFVSRLIERKGLQYVIPQLQNIIKNTDKKICLTIVGDGPYRGELEELVKECHMENRVCFEGQKEKKELVSYYQRADVFILPSKKEGMPNVVLEAMACGMPIIMTPCEGSHELINGNGYICKVEDFGGKLILLCNNEKQRKKCGEESLKIIQQEFQWQKVVQAYERILLLAKNERAVIRSEGNRRVKHYIYLL